MDEKNYTGLVPAQVKGREITSSESKQMDNDHDARDFYHVVKERLKSVNDWKQWAGSWTANFQLTDQKGNEVNRPVEKGDHFKINIPGPENESGHGYDWVQVEDVKEVNEENVDSMAIRVRPASNPKTGKHETAHFYSGDSTSTFVLTREGNTLTVSVYDRNIEANDENDNSAENIRNAIVGTGAKFFGSGMQWDALAKGLLQDAEK